MSYLNFWYTYIFTLGLGIEWINQSVKENHWFTELFLRLCLVFASVTLCILRSGTWEGNCIYYRPPWKWSKSKLTCFNHIAMCPPPAGHPVEPFCFAFFLLTLWTKPDTSLAILTTPNPNSSKWKHSFTSFSWRLRYVLCTLLPPY